MRLANKIALITDGATEIERTIALSFAQEGIGVVIADINDAANAQAHDHFVHCDTSQTLFLRKMDRVLLFAAK
jgi:NAD(P)-dependent dehydrogenase (short-subunit alcohol dehydrogenase family)